MDVDGVDRGPAALGPLHSGACPHLDGLGGDAPASHRWTLLASWAQVGASGLGPIHMPYPE